MSNSLIDPNSDTDHERSGSEVNEDIPNIRARVIAMQFAAHGSMQTIRACAEKKVEAMEHVPDNQLKELAIKEKIEQAFLATAREHPTGELPENLAIANWVMANMGGRSASTEGRGEDALG